MGSEENQATPKERVEVQSHLSSLQASCKSIQRWEAKFVCAMNDIHDMLSGFSGKLVFTFLLTISNGWL